MQLQSTNPYLQGGLNTISSNLTNNLNQNILPGINQQALANGGVGGSRQGIAQGLAIGNTNQAIANAQSQYLNNAYQADQNFYTAQRGQDLQQASLGASLANQGNLGLVGQGQQLYDAGNTQMQAPWQALNWYSQLLSPFSGLGQSTTQTTPGGSKTGNILGGALTAAQLWQLFGS